MALRIEKFIFFLWIIAITISGLHSFSVPPSIGATHQKIPLKNSLSGASPHVLDVYKSYSDASDLGQKLQYREATTIRSFSSKVELLDEGYIFYDLRILNQEEIVGAELHFFVPHSIFELQDSFDSVKIQLFEGLEDESFVLLQESTVFPNDFGWKVFTLKSTVKKWHSNPNQNYGIKVKILGSLGNEISSEIVQSNYEPVLIVFSSDSNASESTPPFYDTQVPNKVESLLSSENMVAWMKTARKIRSVSSDDEKDDNSCRLHELQLNFADIGWNFILYPESVNVSICRGICTASNMLIVPHRVFALKQAYEVEKLSKEDVPALSCSPTEHAPLNIVFIDDDGHIVSHRLSDMIVTGCGCRYN